MEKRYHTTAEELDTTKAKLEEAIVQKKQMEKQLRELEDGLIAGKIIRQPSKRLISSKSGDIRKQGIHHHNQMEFQHTRRYQKKIEHLLQF